VHIFSGLHSYLLGERPAWAFQIGKFSITKPQIEKKGTPIEIKADYILTCCFNE